MDTNKIYNLLSLALFTSLFPSELRSVASWAFKYLFHAYNLDYNMENHTII